MKTVRLVIEHDPDYRGRSTSAYSTKEKAEESFNWNLNQFLDSRKMETVDELRDEFDDPDSWWNVDFTPNEYLSIDKLDYQLIVKEITIDPENDYLEVFY